MKRLPFLMIAVSIMATACGGDGYVIDGAVKDVPELEYVYLYTRGTEMKVLDSALVKEGKFEFKGEQAKTAAPMYVMFKDNSDRSHYEEIYLEPGKISVVIDKDRISVSGTVSNDARGLFFAQYKVLQEEMQDLYLIYRTNDTLTETQKEEILKEMDAKEARLHDYVYEQMKTYAGTHFGTYLLVGNAKNYDAACMDSLMAKVPQCQKEDKLVVDLNESIQANLNSRPGKKFTDVSLMTPDSTAVKLSDYIGKDRYVLMVFWAAWNRNCRDGMPLLVSAYQELHPKGLEILGLDMDMDERAFEDMVENLGMTWPQVCEPKIWNGLSPKVYAVNEIPTLLLVDKSGTIVSRLTSIPEMIEKMKELIK